MPLPSRVCLSLVVVAALCLASCGRNEATALAQAKSGLARDDSRAARAELKNLILAHPRSGEARFLLGEQLLADGEPAQALIEFQRAQEYGHPESAVLPRMAEAMIQSGQAHLVQVQFGAVRLADPEATARLQAAVAQSHAIQGDRRSADSAIERALAAAPGSLAALLAKARLAGDSPAALATLEEALAAHPDSHEAWALKGELLLRLKADATQAMAALTKSLQIRSNQVRVHALLVALHLSRGDLDAARQQHDTLRALAPRHPNTLLLEGQLAYAAGQHDRARDLYQALLRELPEDVSLLLSAGENELQLNATLQAEAHLAKALALAPRHDVARRLLALAQLRLGQAAKALVTLAPLVDAPDVSADVLALAAQARRLNGEPTQADALFDRIARLKPTDTRLRTLVASAGLGKGRDGAVLDELRSIANDDAGIAADQALVSAHLQRGDLDATLQALDRLQRKQPGNANAYLQRGQVLAKRHDLVGARRQLEQALSVAPDHFPALAALAALDLKAGQADAARRRLEEFVKIHPRHGEALLALAELAQDQGALPVDVLKQLNAAIKANPTDAVLRAALVRHHLDGNDDAAALTAAQTASVDLPESLELLELLGRCQLRTGQTSQALATYSKIATLEPRSVRGLLGQARAYLASDDLDMAQRSAQRALALDDTHSETLRLAVKVALRRHQPAVALALANTRQQQRGGEAEGHRLEGEIALQLGQADLAVVALRKALERGGPEVVAIELHQALVRAGRLREAEGFAERRLGSHPHDDGFLFYLGQTAQARGNTSAAEQRYRQLLARRPDHALALNNLAMLQIQGHRPGATALAEQALRHAPRHPQLLDTLAQAQAAEAQWDRAIDAQKQAVALAPSDGALRLRLARFYVESGDKALARSELGRLGTLDPGSPLFDEARVLQQALAPTLPGR